eukprot:scaffold13390_cov96-Skeletonema_marinoi.AAC.2
MSSDRALALLPFIANICILSSQLTTKYFKTHTLQFCWESGSVKGFAFVVPPKHWARINHMLRRIDQDDAASLYLIVCQKGRTISGSGLLLSLRRPMRRPLLTADNGRPPTTMGNSCYQARSTKTSYINQDLQYKDCAEPITLTYTITLTSVNRVGGEILYYAVGQSDDGLMEAMAKCITNSYVDSRIFNRNG